MWQKIKDYLKGVQSHTVTYYATGFMSNKYKVLTCTFTSTRKERSKFGSIPSVGFYKNYKSLEKHYKKRGSIIKFSSATHESSKD